MGLVQVFVVRALNDKTILSRIPIETMKQDIFPLDGDMKKQRRKTKKTEQFWTWNSYFQMSIKLIRTVKYFLQLNAGKMCLANLCF